MIKATFFAALVAVAAARPDAPRRTYAAPPTNTYSAHRSDDSNEEVAILRDDRVYPSAAGQYSLDFETADGTKISESGYGSGPDGAVESQGTVRFVHPDGESFVLKYIANAEGGYQPESDALPVAPAFPHEIPQFVLDQIAKAAREDEEAARSAPSGRYAAPEPTNTYRAPRF
ncbi:cuticle protein AM1159-like isoform X2 [Hyalella azteca]|uniref:Cuticle protein AM1159-like isoform X2 n=1 Tax=Hyalella azteca TaxID=294128 RepID=A0A8B7NMW8_HYAAZ|nr:cuticle protein AM1159-like isoform X2 [Hyalella azteca]